MAIDLYFFFFFFKSYGDPQDLHKRSHSFPTRRSSDLPPRESWSSCPRTTLWHPPGPSDRPRSEEHTSELQSRTLISYAVFCLKIKKKKKKNNYTNSHIKKKKNNTFRIK